VVHGPEFPRPRSGAKGGGVSSGCECASASGQKPPAHSDSEETPPPRLRRGAGRPRIQRLPPPPHYTQILSRRIHCSDCGPLSGTRPTLQRSLMGACRCPIGKALAIQQSRQMILPGELGTFPMEMLPPTARRITCHPDIEAPRAIAQDVDEVLCIHDCTLLLSSPSRGSNPCEGVHPAPGAERRAAGSPREFPRPRSGAKGGGVSSGCECASASG
jgi:hypothetical protein